MVLGIFSNKWNINTIYSHMDAAHWNFKFIYAKKWINQSVFYMLSWQIVYVKCSKTVGGTFPKMCSFKTVAILYYYDILK